jgi:type I restriction enzyme M protein
VPEGIIFQSGTAYKSLRKMLIDKYLWAVVSLPAGIFNPYSGVKTSILLLDKTLSKKTDNVLFVKVQEDGFGLGAQRRANDKNDLPTALNLLKKYQTSLKEQQATPFGDAVHDDMALVISKAKIIENGDYNFSGDRYKDSTDKHYGIYDFVELQDVCEKITDGTHQTPTYADEGFIFLSSKNVTSRKIDWENVKYIPQELHLELSKRLKPKLNDVLLAKNGTTGVAAIVDKDLVFDIYVSLALLRAKDNILPKYLLFLINSDFVKVQFNSKLKGVGVPNLHLKDIKEVKIPLPSLAIQHQIVAEIEGYQQVIDGAKQVIKAYKPHISIKKHWEMVELEEVCEIKRGKFSHRPRNAPQFYGGDYPFIQTGDIVKAKGGKINYTQTLNKLGLSVSKLFPPTIVLITVAANIGDTAILDYPACFPDSVVGLIPKENISPYYLELIMRTKRQYLNDIAPQAAQKNINIEILKDVKIPLPPLSEQLEIVSAIEKEQQLVNANKKLVAIMEEKIKAKIAEVWGEEKEVKPVKKEVMYHVIDEPLAMVAEV